MSVGLEGRTAVVLGASNKGGTGWRIAERFAAEGAHVFVAARRKDGIDELAGAIGGTAVLCDATKDDDVARLATCAAARTGQIDAAIYAAGVPIGGSLLAVGRSRIDSALAVNLVGAFLFLREIVPHMVPGGTVTLLSSLSSTHVFHGFAPYGVAKAGLNALVRYAASEFAPRGIRVNAIIPGLIDTPMAQELIESASDELMREVPLGKPVRPEEIAALCMYLALDAPSITGAAIPVDGGNHMTRFSRPDELSRSGKRL